MGHVYRASQAPINRDVAIKVLRVDLAHQEGVAERFKREARAASMIQHPNAITIFDFDQDGDILYLAMEFLSGETLRQRLRREPPMEIQEALDMFEAMAGALGAAHKVGVVHRDLKPDNIMLDSDGRVRVLDFGLAYGVPAMHEPAAFMLESSGSFETTPFSRLTRTGELLGTPNYMAPEQWQGRALEAAADQFSWCVTAWELLYGERPFHGSTLPEYAESVLSGRFAPPPRGRKVPSWLRRVLERGLAVNPADRWPSMTALLAAIEREWSRARLWTAVRALAVFAALGSAMMAHKLWGRAQRAAACAAAADAEIAAVWGDSARSAVSRTLPDEARTTLLPHLERYAEVWRSTREAVCRHVEVDGRWGPDLRDGAEWCVSARKREFAVLVDALGSGEVSAVVAAGVPAKFDAIVPCLDPDHLQRQAIPPADIRAEVVAAAAELDRSTALELRGHTDEALAAARAARDRPVGASWRSIWAQARLREGRLLAGRGELAAAEAAMSEAYFAAASVDAWTVASEASWLLAELVGRSLARPNEGRVWSDHARISVELAGDSDARRAMHRLSLVDAIERSRPPNATVD